MKVIHKQLELLQDGLLQAKRLQEHGQTQQAIQLLKKLLKKFPLDTHLLTALGSMSLQIHEPKQTIKYLSKSLAINPMQNEAWFNQGIAQTMLKQFNEAILSFDRVIALDPKCAQAYNNLGNIYTELGFLDEALTTFNQAITLKPDYAEAFYNLGNTLQSLGRNNEAINRFDRAVALHPEFAEAYNNRGNALMQTSRLDDALSNFDMALTLQPAYTEASQNREKAVAALQRLDQALTNEFCEPLSLADVDALINHGNTLQDIQQYAQAIPYYELAIKTEPEQANAFYNLGLAQQELRLYNAALDSYAQAIRLAPDIAAAYNNRGNVYAELLNTAEAESHYDQAIAKRPDYADAHWNKALLKIKLGQFTEGWQLYEWRWKSPHNEKPRDFGSPPWLGESPVAGKTLFIHHEQGLGDFIQFCRYVLLLDSMGANIILECPTVLLNLAATLGKQFQLLEKGQQPPQFDLHCPLMSLPLACKTTLENVPTNIPYLTVDPLKQQHWQQLLGGKNRVRIGLTWSGSTTHKDDDKRSIPFKTLSPLLDLPFEFHAIQKEFRSRDQAPIKAQPSLHTHQQALQDFTDTAALIKQMDLLISVDTSVAHLAGALAKPLWLLLPYCPDYRWLLNRNDSVWYSTATLYRQPALGDWPSVIAEIAEKLTADIDNNTL